MAPSPPPTGLPTRLVTEDTPPDMLAGSMDLLVSLPNGHSAKMSVERSTPMMDLLVHITTAHKVSPGGHILQAMGERGILPYKPSTPIGTLDTWSIRVVPRNQASGSATHVNHGKRAPPKPIPPQSQQQPFEQTFRLQVRLPRNQLFVVRLSPRTSLADVLEYVCREKNLDVNKYELRHPVNTDQPLQLALTLADYRITQVLLVARGSIRASSGELSSSDIPGLQVPSSEDPVVVHQQCSSITVSSASSGNIFTNMLRRTRSSGKKEGSLSGDSLGGRSSSPAHSDESVSRSVSPPGPLAHQITSVSQQQLQQPPPPPRHRKGRAPKPPSQPLSGNKGANDAQTTTIAPAVVSSTTVSTTNKNSTTVAVKVEEKTALVISHSRNSSDSSGYHEASVLSDSPENHANHHVRPIESSQNITTSTTTTLGGKKKRAAPLPPQVPRVPAMVPSPEPASTPVHASPATSIVLETAALTLKQPIPQPRAHVKLAPAPPPPKPVNRQFSKPDGNVEPPPVAPRVSRTTSASNVFTKSNRSNSAAVRNKSDKKNKIPSIGSATGSVISKRRGSQPSSIGSTSSSVFGVGKSLLSIGNSQNLGSYLDDVDNLDLDMFENSKTGSLNDDDEVREAYNSLMNSKRRNSLTQIMQLQQNDRARNPKAPKPVGYRVRPKLENVFWKTVDQLNVDNTEDEVHREFEDTWRLNKSVSEPHGERAESSLPLSSWPNSWALHDDAHLTSTHSDSSSLSDDDRKESPVERKEPTSNDPSYNNSENGDDRESVCEDDLDSAFQSVTDVLEEQLRVEASSKARQEELAERQERSSISSGEGGGAKVLDKKMAVQEVGGGGPSDEDDGEIEAREEQRRLEEERELERLRLEEERRLVEEERRRAEEERLRLEEERRLAEEEAARIRQEKEELARQRREQQLMEQQLRERLQRELEEKQRARQEEQKREIERLQKEQEELERELREWEKQKKERMQERQPATLVKVETAETADFPDWEYKLPAPPSAFRDKQSHSEGREVKTYFDFTDKATPEVEVRNKINSSKTTYSDPSDESDMRPRPPEVVEMRKRRVPIDEDTMENPPIVSVVPLRSAHSLYSLMNTEEFAANEAAAPRPMRKSSSVADVSLKADEGTEEEDEESKRLQQLQQQFVQWQQQLINNQNVLQGHVSMPLQSLQVLREILPQMKQKMTETPPEPTPEPTSLKASTLPRTVPAKPVTSEVPTSSTLDRRSTPPSSNPTPAPRFIPPTINLGTWNERPKSEVSIKLDSDYRVGVGQQQPTLIRGPIQPNSELKLKDTTNLIGGAAVNRDVVTRSNSWRIAPTHKPSVVTIHGLQSASATEQVRASNKPTVVLRNQPINEIPQRRYTTLVGINGAQAPVQSKTMQQHRISLPETSNPVVKGFKIQEPQPEVFSMAPPPPPPPMVVRSVTKQPARTKSVQPSNDDGDVRDQLMDAIKNFGGRSNLRKTRSMQF